MDSVLFPFGGYCNPHPLYSWVNQLYLSDILIYLDIHTIVHTNIYSDIRPSNFFFENS